MNKIYIHYGHKHFENDKFTDIKNRVLNKPLGGLWASPVDSEYSWKNWNEESKVVKCQEFNSFKFTLKNNSKILKIDSHKKACQLPIQKGFEEYDVASGAIAIIDFEKLAKEYDAIEVLISKDYQLYWYLYGWDCDTLLVFNKECMEVCYDFTT